MIIALSVGTYLYACGLVMFIVANLEHSSTFFGRRPLWWGVLWTVLWPLTIPICLTLVFIDPNGRIFKYLPGGN